jgi:hypothetical protein
MAHTTSLNRPWHTNLLMAIVAIDAAWTFVAVLFALVSAPPRMLGLLDYYVFLSAPLLLAAAAYLLFAKSSLAVLPFALLPGAYFWAAIRLHPEYLSPSRWTTLAGYLGQFPSTYMASAAFCALSAIYCLFLNKHTGLSRPLTSDQMKTEARIQLTDLLERAEASLAALLVDVPDSKHRSLATFYSEIRANAPKREIFPTAAELFWDDPQSKAEEQCLNDALKVFKFIGDQP